MAEGQLDRVMMASVIRPMAPAVQPCSAPEAVESRQRNAGRHKEEAHRHERIGDVQHGGRAAQGPCGSPPPASEPQGVEQACAQRQHGRRGVLRGRDPARERRRPGDEGDDVQTG